MNTTELIQALRKQSASGSFYNRAQIRRGITITKKAPSVQPSVPRIPITTITTRAISAPMAPTALGRTSSIISAAPLGGGAIPTPSPGVGGGLDGSISGIGSNIIGTVKQYIPLAIKVVLAIIVIKILLWLLKGRR